MSARQRLPAQCKAKLCDFDHGARKWTATIGRFRNGRVAGISLDAAKESPLIEPAQECAIVASLAQAGCPLETLPQALAGRSVGPFGEALALIGEACRMAAPLPSRPDAFLIATWRYLTADQELERVDIRLGREVCHARPS